MPRSISYFTTSPHEENGSDGFDPTALGPRTAPPSPSAYRRHYGQLLLPDAEVDETTSLLERDGAGRRTVPRRSYTSVSATSPAPPQFRHTLSSGSLRRPRHHSRANSHGMRYSRRGSLSADQAPASTKDGMTASFTDDRTWYDQFTSTDWVHDSIADGARLRKLRSRKDIRGRLLAWFDGAQGWILVAVIGCITAALAYFVDVTEMSLFSIKEGFCSTQWFQNQRRCCGYSEECVAWKSWSQILRPSSSSAAASGDQWLDFAAFIFWVVLLSMVSCSLTLLTKTVVSSSASLSTLDENLGAEARDAKSADVGSPTSDAATNRYQTLLPSRPAMRYYSAAGSGVAEVKVINSGFVLHGYLGMKTLVCKTLALIFSVSSGLSIGKEGPYVHIGACVGNVCCRLFSKYHHNDGKRREVLSASAASGLSVAFGAPIGGVLFSLEEVSYYFPPKTLFRTFFCCIAAALSLKFLNPYGTGKIVLFEVRYLSDWEIFEIGLFILLGVLGGAAGALFIKASSLWARSFRRIPAIKRGPMLEVVLVAVVTGLISFWNRYTKLAVSELMFELASPCDQAGVATGLCPDADGVLEVIGYLAVAFVIKSFLTVVTFGVKVPAGIYVPSMVVGGLMGRIVGHVAQYFTVTYPDFFLFASCSAKDGMESCVTPGIYAMIAAGATMCGVTRLSVTLAVILFELTGSLDHVLPFCLAVLCAKWTADAIEPRSIYDLLTDMNSYPFLDNKHKPLSDAELGDLVRPVRKNRVIDISDSLWIPATELRSKLEHLLMAGEFDSGLPILRHNVLAGIIPVPDLEFALDNLDNEETTLCLMAVDSGVVYESDDDEEGEGGGRTAEEDNRADFTRYIDPSPIALDIHSPIDLVYQCFTKLGLRYLCVTHEGQYAGLVHKKAFVKFMKEHD